MAKNRKKNKKDAAPMDISTENHGNIPEAMDTSEGKTPNPALGAITRKTRSVPMKRSKNLRKLKAIERAISIGEKSQQKVSKNKSKMLRIQSAKSLYD